MKKIKVLATLLTIILLYSASVNAQTTTTSKRMKTPYPVWSVSPMAGVAFPIGAFGDNFKSGLSFGIDVSNKLNKETGLYAKVGYSIFPSKLAGVSDVKILEYTAGPRYFFTSKNLKSSIFFEVGLGGYSYGQDAYVLTVNGVATNVPKTTSTNFGVNAGMGAVLNVSKPIDFIIKAKYHDIFTTNGSTSFIEPLLGIDIRF